MKRNDGIKLLDRRFISAVTVVDDEKGYRRRFRGGLITQREDEGDGEFSDRSDLEREEMMLALVDESIKTAKSRKPPRTSSERP